MHKKIIVTALFFVFSVQSSNVQKLTDSDDDGLYNNGILGLGFAPKDMESQRREEILDRTRIENDQTMQSEQRDISCYLLFADMLNIATKGLVWIFVGEPIDRTQKKGTNPYPPSDFIVDSIVVQPVVANINSVHPYLKFSSITQLDFRKKLHSLRQKFKEQHTKLDDIDNASDYESALFQEEKFFSKQDMQLLFRDFADGIEVRYTDNHVVTIQAGQTEGYFIYSVRKNIK